MRILETYIVHYEGKLCKLHSCLCVDGLKSEHFIETEGNILWVSYERAFDLLRNISTEL